MGHTFFAKAMLRPLDSREFLFIVLDEMAMPFPHHSVPLPFQTASHLGNATRILGIEFATNLQHPPIRRYCLLSLEFGFMRGMSCNPGEDPGRHGTAHGGAML